MVSIKYYKMPWYLHGDKYFTFLLFARYSALADMPGLWYSNNSLAAKYRRLQYIYSGYTKVSKESRHGKRHQQKSINHLYQGPFTNVSSIIQWTILNPFSFLHISFFPMHLQEVRLIWFEVSLSLSPYNFLT